jgi:hypothetical protein
LDTAKLPLNIFVLSCGWWGWGPAVNIIPINIFALDSEEIDLEEINKILMAKKNVKKT